MTGIRMESRWERGREDASKAKGCNRETKLWRIEHKVGACRTERRNEVLRRDKAKQGNEERCTNGRR